MIREFPKAVETPKEFISPEPIQVPKGEMSEDVVVLNKKLDLILQLLQEKSDEEN